MPFRNIDWSNSNINLEFYLFIDKSNDTQDNNCDNSNYSKRKNA